MKATVQIPVEVSNNVTTRGKYTFQTVYVDIGNKFPIELEVFVFEDNGPRKPGKYVASKLEHTVENRRHSFTLNLNDLSPASA